MIAVHDVRSTHSPRSRGGPPARRAVGRWALRLFIRERRQQLLVVSVIAIAVAAAACSVATVYNIPDSPAARFGTAQQMLHINSSDPAEVAERIASARATLGTIEVIGHQSVQLPGSTESYDARTQDPHGVYAASTLRILNGRFPDAAGEVAVTNEAAKEFGVHTGDTISLARTSKTVVGLVENPYDLSDEFVLLPPAAGNTPDEVTILAKASDDQLRAFRDSTTRANLEQRGTSVSKSAAAGMLAASTVVFLLVALVAAAGFAVVAQRRMRQLGMLAAVGATDRHLKLVLIVHGAVVGIVAAPFGTVLGLAGWIALSHRLEGSVAHRIDTFHLPWTLLIGALVVGVVVPVAAAWWPSRAMPRMSIVDAISARPPKPRRADTSVLLAIIFLAGGVVLTDLSNQTKPLLLIGGMIAIVAGILLACPTAIRLLAGTARRAPVTIRVALRDLGRYQARAGAALAAISLALGIPIAIVLVASAADRTSALHAGNGNLADTQLLIRLDQPKGSSDGAEPLAPNLTPAQMADVHAAIDRLGATLGNATIVPLEMATDAAANPANPRLVDLAEPVGGNNHTYRALTAYVATPELLSFLGVDTSTIPSDAEVLTTNQAAPIMPITRSIEEPAHAVITSAEYTSLPKAFITEAGLDRYHLVPTPVGWIVEAPHPLTADQLTVAREVATSSGFRIEARHGPMSRAAIRTIATAAGALFALAIVAMTVGTIRSEASADLRTLTATGASSSIRRALTATTAGALALAGVVLGVIGAYLGLGGAYAHHLDRLGDVPVAHLLIALVAVPVLAGAVGWCLGGREPRTFARPAID